VFKFGETMDKKTANNLNPIVLAFVGDAVYSLFVRERLTFLTNLKTGELNKRATAEVNASAQAIFAQEIMPLLTEEELGVFKRARNAKKPTKAKTATVAEYNTATGLEAVLGYLYIIGDYKRLDYILNKGIDYES
jgi:ribonuclease-3 family protein